MGLGKDKRVLIEALQKLLVGISSTAENDHQRETYQRAFLYASNRVIFGDAKSLGEAKMAFAAFGDGFCTGVHRAKGKKCKQNLEDQARKHQSN